MTLQSESASAAKPEKSVVRVCMGGTKVQEYPLQQHATHETLRNVYFEHRELPQSDLDAYNRFTDEINRATYHTDREFLLDQRHRAYVAAMYAQREHASGPAPLQYRMR